jgi:hypothetical protein
MPNSNDNTTQNPAVTPPPEGNSPATQEGAAESTQSNLIADISKLDPKVLQSYTDKAVQQAIATREKNIQVKAEEEKKAAELKAAEERGEFDKVKADYEAKMKALSDSIENQKQEALINKVNYRLEVEAFKLGINEVRDLVVLTDEQRKSCIAEDGTVKSEAVTEVLAKLKAERPHFFGANVKGHSGNPSPGNANPPVGAPVIMSQEQSIKQRQQQYNNMRKAPDPHIAYNAAKKS